jgi:glycosyltransferase involved in cell wall biosynthesis
MGEEGDAIEKEGFVLHPVRFARGRLPPWRALRMIMALRKVLREVEPAIVHYVGLELTVLGVMASLRRRFAAVYEVAGLDHALVEDGHSRRRRTRLLLRFGLNRRHAVGLVQNPDDRDVLAGIGVKRERIVLIAGPGVDADHLRPIPEPEGAVTVAYVGRMVDDKGVRSLVEAYRMLRDSHIGCDLLLAGSPDPASPSNIAPNEIATWAREPGISWLGQVQDVAVVWQRAHVAVLPSRGGEGVPKSLLEAAACGRPLIATDVPGSREIVIHERTGLLVPVDTAGALASAIGRLVRSSPQRVRMGVAARRLVDERFSADLVGKAAVALYRGLLDIPQ